MEMEAQEHSMDIQALQIKLGYTFKDPALLVLALSHSSYANEAGQEDKHNERLEFLGDAVLELCISAWLFKAFPETREGDLTRLRAELVNTEMLGNMALALDLDTSLQLGRGEEQQGGRTRHALLADAMEAVLGSIFLDGGFHEACAFVERLYAAHWPEKPVSHQKKDAKSRLQEATQSLLRVLPLYSLVQSEGPEHARVFTVEVSLPDGRVWRADGSSVKRAEHEAANKALAALEQVKNTPKRER